MALQDLAEARSTVARLTDESVGLRTDNQGLANELAQLRETYEQVIPQSCLSGRRGGWGGRLI